MSKREVRNLVIPEGLNQERVDAALSRLLGLSRNVIVGLIESGEISKSLAKGRIILCVNLSIV